MILKKLKIKLIIAFLMFSSFVYAMDTHTWTAGSASSGIFDSTQIELNNPGECDAKVLLSTGYIYPQINPTGTCNNCPGTGTDGISDPIVYIANNVDTFNECNGYDCSRQYTKTGTKSVSDTQTCYNIQDEPASTHSCDGNGNCQTDVCNNNPIKDIQYSCGTCQFISNTNCEGSVKGVCSNYPTGTTCGTNEFTGLNFCLNDDVYRKFITRGCSGGSCISTTTDELQIDCNSYQYCKDGACLYTYRWVAGSYGACSASCGAGTQTRPVVCKRSDGANVADANCAGLIKPVTSRSCTGGSCTTYVTCQSWDYRATSCNAGKRIKTISVQARYSSAPCLNPGRTYQDYRRVGGRDGNWQMVTVTDPPTYYASGTRIYVSRGCRAKFRVTFY